MCTHTHTHKIFFLRVLAFRLHADASKYMDLHENLICSPFLSYELKFKDPSICFGYICNITRLSLKCIRANCGGSGEPSSQKLSWMAEIICQKSRTSVVNWKDLAKFKDFCHELAKYLYGISVKIKAQNKHFLPIFRIFYAEKFSFTKEIICVS